MRIADDRGVEPRIMAPAHVHDAPDAVDRPAARQLRETPAVERVDGHEESEDCDELDDEHRHETACESPPLRGERIGGLRGRYGHLRCVHHSSPRGIDTPDCADGGIAR